MLPKSRALLLLLYYNGQACFGQNTFQKLLSWQAQATYIVNTPPNFKLYAQQKVPAKSIKIYHIQYFPKLKDVFPF